MPNRLKALLGDILEQGERRTVMSSYDVIGDIIVVKIPDSLLHKKYAIGKRLLDCTRSAKSVFMQTSSVEGEFRLRKLELLAGANRTLTEYHEHGCRFKVDIREVYFSPRLATERLRIAQSVRDGELITNMFAGVGTFSILIAKRNPSSRIFSIDSNPIASVLCLINSRLNGVQDRVYPICGDARYVASSKLLGLSHRVLMPLPEKAKEFVQAGIACVRADGGVVHYFMNVRALNKKEAITEGKLQVTEAFRQYYHIVNMTRVVREVGPRYYQTVSDVLVASR